MAAALEWLFRSRLRVVLIVVGVLVLLDVGRSLYARLAYAEATERWQPDPSVYADIKWPPGADLPASTPAGARVYAQHCAVCHGPDGRGNGPAAPSLIPRPRDFTLGQYKYKSTPAGEPANDDDLLNVVANGLHASSMPYWKDLLSDAEMRAVVATIKSMSPVFKTATAASLAIPPRGEPDASSVARGRVAFAARGCAGCHGADGRGGLNLQDAKGYPVVSRDLSAPWTFRGGHAPQDIYLRISTGLAPGPMPSLADDVKVQERWDLVNYVLSLARTPPWEPGGKLAGPGQSADLTRRGEYLVHAEMCGLCHTMINATGIYRGDDRYLAGGMRVGAYPHGVLVSRNLTSDVDTGLGGWSEQQIVDALRNGRAGDRVLNVFDMPWVYFHGMRDDDAVAIARYLKQLPPVHNAIPPILRYGFIETVVAKVTRPLPAAPTTVLTYADQGFGLPEHLNRRGSGQAILVAAQWLVLAAGVVAFAFAGPRERRFPKTGKRWLRAIAGVLGLLLVGAIGAMLYELPHLRVIPPEQIVAGATAGLYQPERSKLANEEQATLAERGRYLFAIASCALCHGTDASGGAKISWKPMGTLWTRNLTPHPEAGLGQWSDAQISRAIRSGVSRNGQALHWQGMTWDHASNWDEEDIRALIAYLRLLPAVNKKIQPDRAPAADDCDVYTFWTSTSHTPGCGQ